MKVTRREFLSSSVALVGLSRKAERPIAGSFVFEDCQRGHLVRDRAAFPPPTRRVKIPLVIVGGGVAGLSAAWWLDKHHFHDFVLLEMEDQAGGNARFGQNEVTPYPWAAHYVPVPGPRATLVRMLFEELGVLKNGEWEERYLCFSPQERLFLYGRWQEGIEPNIGLTRKDHDQFQRLYDRMGEFRATGQFTIPMELGARPSTLDQISYAEWLRQEQFDSPYLNWYADYCCRDDYGTLATEISAWVGIHYFASREPVEKGPLTWPEGEGWIVKRLLEKLGRYVRTGSMVRRITPGRSSLRVLAEDTEYTCEVIIFAAPSFLAPYVIDQFPPVNKFVYSPWLTANLTLDRFPAEGEVGLAWDNVIYNSPTLGYVVANHQTLRMLEERSVWTFYWALAHGSPASNRQRLLEEDWGYWKEAILGDLARAHPDIRSCVSRIDILRLAHAMIRPSVGLIFSEERQRLAKLTGRLLFANADLSGISLFEEAQYRGVKAADRALRLLGGPPSSALDPAR